MTLGSPCQAALGATQVEASQGQSRHGLRGSGGGTLQEWDWQMGERGESPAEEKCEEE